MGYSFGEYLYRRILQLFCSLGYHSWTWRLKDNESIYLDGTIPKGAVCKHCSIRYKGGGSK